MPRTISEQKVRLIAPIIERIDIQLARPQEDRIDIPLEATDNAGAKALKQMLETYKQTIRPDWKAKFLMRVKGADLTIEFNGLQPTHFRFKEVLGPGEFRIKPVVDAQFPSDPLMEDLEDRDAAQRILMESPQVLVLNPLHLSMQTMDFLRAPDSTEPTALGRVLQRNAYKWTVYDNKVRIYLISAPLPDA